MKQEQIKRLEAKTTEQRFLQMLEQDFNQAPRVAQVILEEAQDCLWGQREGLRAGQMRVILVQRGEGHGRALRETKTKEVVWTVDGGLADREVLKRQGRVALRRVRIQRLLGEAVEQGAMATQEDLAQVLQVSVRTIKRDCKQLQEQRVYLPTRGKVQGIGRGQTHKAQIVGRWLAGETYDQITLHTHHSLVSVQRYIRTFVRVIHMSQQGFSEDQIALLMEISRPLVKEYLAVYRQNDSPECRERLAAQLQRRSGGGVVQPPKKGAQ